MIQGGDPTDTGEGGASIYGPTFADEIASNLSHNKRGIVSMANSGKDTNGSQFFILFSPQDHLDGTYSIFAHMIDGEDALALMETIATDDDERPVREIRIERVTVHANPFAQL